MYQNALRPSIEYSIEYTSGGHIISNGIYTSEEYIICDGICSEEHIMLSIWYVIIYASVSHMSLDFLIS